MGFTLGRTCRVLLRYRRLRIGYYVFFFFFFFQESIGLSQSSIHLLLTLVVGWAPRSSGGQRAEGHQLCKKHPVTQWLFSIQE